VTDNFKEGGQVNTSSRKSKASKLLKMQQSSFRLPKIQPLKSLDLQ